MTPPPDCANCSSAKDHVRQAQVWARKHGVNKLLVNKRLKHPQEAALTSAAGPLLAARPSPTTGLKRPSADSPDQSPKRPCPAGSQTLGLAARFSAFRRDPTPIVLSPEPTFPQAPASSVPIHLPPPAEPAGLLNHQIAEISRNLRDNFPENPLWEEAVFPVAAVLKYVGAFREMYRALLHISAVTPAQRRRRYATFLVGINQLVERLELAVIVPTDKRTLRAQQNLEEALRNEPHPAQPTAAEYSAPIPAEPTRRSSESKLP
ncbi:hypothetical protein PTTG_00936 [Puccinia triticina 1-1 BBBD Race 1]|uniref:Uncharacterized protein n=1 Tax=Puccinia triticina (isolate 1-1 / race 1 (BBBD)) TaxID=630390 RepID=A0A0C4EJL5_PUCT1|nr:hypothetical protein PTTG_00936 [Puccinia triticina 1-1 BBBD Race 1]